MVKDYNFAPVRITLLCMNPLVKSCFLTLMSAVLYCSAHAQPGVADSLKALAGSTTNDTVRIKCWRDLGFIYTRISSGVAKKYFRQAIKLGEQIHENIYTCSTYGQLCMLYANEGNHDSAVYFLHRAKQLAEREKDNQRQWADYYQAEGIYYRHKGAYKSALSSYFQCLKFLKTAGNTTGEAGCYINIGNIYKKTGALYKAIEYELKALKLFEDLKHKQGMAFCYQNIGDIFITLKQYKNALKYLQQAATLKTELGDKKGMASLLKGMSLAASGLGKYPKALSYGQKALLMYRELKLKPEVADGCLVLSRVYRAMNNLKLAEEYLRLADSTANGIGDKALSARIASEKMDIDTFFGSRKPAPPLADNLYKGLGEAYESGDSNRVAGNYQSLSVYYAHQKDFKRAYEYRMKYDALQNSITGRDIQLQIRELETQYQVEKKEKQILLLQKDKALAAARMQQQRFFLMGALLLAALVAVISFLLISRSRIIQKSKRLLEMEKMRNHIARDLHDDIGSTLSSIQLMGSVALKHKTEAGYVKEYLEKIVDNSMRMSVSMQDIVWAINPVNDSVGKIISRMKEYAAERLEPLDIMYHFTVTKNVGDVKLTLHQRKDLFMIYKEIINNTAKYSDCNLVQIDLMLHDRHLNMSVSDNGKGFDKEKHSTGNGLVNMRARAGQMNALFSIDSEKGKGTTVTLFLPLSIP